MYLFFFKPSFQICWLLAFWINRTTRSKFILETALQTLVYKYLSTSSILDTILPWGCWAIRRFISNFPHCSSHMVWDHMAVSVFLGLRWKLLIENCHGTTIWDKTFIKMIVSVVIENECSELSFPLVSIYTFRTLESVGIHV